MLSSNVQVRSSCYPLLGFALLVTTLCSRGNAQPTHAQAHDHVQTNRVDAKSLALPKEEGVFHFIVYGDRTSGVPEGLKYLRQAVVDTNLLDPDLVMTVGDLIQGYNRTAKWLEEKDEFIGIMDNLRMPWYPVAGNHDVYWERSDVEMPVGQHESNYETHFGPLWYSFKHKNAGFIVLYSDEGDPDTGEKGFNEGRLQQMSEAQLAFLSQALNDCKDMGHVFVFLHHPRWIGGGYTGSNWDAVHNLLASAGNVSAVFAGHIHHMRYDGVRDGIEYFTLATTGGNLEADFPEAGFLHHFNVVTVRKDSFQVATIPVGAVVDPKLFTPEFTADLILAERSTAPSQTIDAFPLLQASTEPNQCTFEFSNPSTKPVELTVEFSRLPQGWRVYPDHQHVYLDPGVTQRTGFRIWAAKETDWDSFKLPNLRVSGEYLAESTRVKLPVKENAIPVRVSSDAISQLQTNEQDQCAVFEDTVSCVKISPASLSIPAGAFTVETWVFQTDQTGPQAVIAKTQNSEFAIAINNGKPKFDLRIRDADGERYVIVKSEQAIASNQWTHLAGVFDAESASLFVNGKRVASMPAAGMRVQNTLSTFIGADPDKNDQPNRFFKGKVDNVRFSKIARYTENFVPAAEYAADQDTLAIFDFERTLGPFVVDASEHHIVGEIIGQLDLQPGGR